MFKLDSHFEDLQTIISVGIRVFCNIKIFYKGGYPKFFRQSTLADAENKTKSLLSRISTIKSMVKLS